MAKIFGFSFYHKYRFLFFILLLTYFKFFSRLACYVLEEGIEGVRRSFRHLSSEHHRSKKRPSACVVDHPWRVPPWVGNFLSSLSRFRATLQTSLVFIVPRNARITFHSVASSLVPLPPLPFYYRA